MNPNRALALQKRGLGDWVAMLGSSSEGARTVEFDGVIGSIVPAVPHRSILNSVSYADADALAAGIDRLAAAYDEAGIVAWTVWVPEFDREAIAMLEAAGHRLDGTPMAMSVELEDFAGVEVGDLDWDAECEPAELGRINDRAYGLEGDDALAGGLSDPTVAGLRLYRARVDGETAAVLATVDHDRDLGFYFVATDPDHRGRGLAGRLITVAVEQARERGLRTSSLQGSAMGQPVYRRLGYGEDFALNMYERRA